MQILRKLRMTVAGRRGGRIDKAGCLHYDPPTFGVRARCTHIAAFIEGRMVRRIPVRLFLILAILSAGGALLPAHYLPLGIMVVPLIGVIGGMLLPQRMRGKTWGLGVSASTLLIAIAMALQYDWYLGGYQFVIHGPRIEQVGVGFS